MPQECKQRAPHGTSMPVKTFHGDAMQALYGAIEY
jgi:hypothetical protein